MRKIVLSLGISLDGYVARSDGSVDFLFMPKDYSNAEFFKSVDVAIMGRKTYEAGKKMGAGGDFFKRWKMEFYVFSKTLPVGERDGVRFVKELPERLVEELRKKPGKDIWHMGGGELAREFLRADLVDEIRLGIVPVLLGEGIPLFPSGFPQREFLLTECRSYSKGMVSLVYERARRGKKKV
jgi:dihydrofolate reductase